MRIFNKLARLNLTIKNFIRFNSEIFFSERKARNEKDNRNVSRRDFVNDGLRDGK